MDIIDKHIGRDDDRLVVTHQHRTVITDGLPTVMIDIGKLPRNESYEIKLPHYSINACSASMAAE